MRARWALGVLGAVLALALLTGCDSGRSDMLRDLIDTENTGSGEVSSERIEELKGKIDEYRDRVEQAVQSAGQLGTYYRMLASEYIDQRMYGMALESLQKAIEIEPENPQLFYLAGLCSGQMAKAHPAEEEERQQLLRDAEQYYQRSLDLDGDKVSALYGLAVLYVFELDQPSKAVPLLEDVNRIEPKNARALMVLGRAHAALGNTSEAAEAYAGAAEVTNDEELRRRAQENRNTLLQGNRQ